MIRATRTTAGRRRNQTAYARHCAVQMDALERRILLSVTGLPGDTNGDGAVTLSDLVTVGLHWQTSVSGGATDGDFSGPAGVPDGEVSLSDLVLVGIYWQTTNFVPGDANRDGRIDVLDLNIVALHWQSHVTGRELQGDFTGPAEIPDGIVDQLDLDLVLASMQIPPSIPPAADTNGDGRVDDTDYNTLMSHWGEYTSRGDAYGDFTGDWMVDQADLDFLNAHWHAGIEPVSTLLKREEFKGPTATTVQTLTSTNTDSFDSVTGQINCWPVGPSVAPTPSPGWSGAINGAINGGVNYGTFNLNGLSCGRAGAYVYMEDFTNASVPTVLFDFYNNASTPREVVSAYVDNNGHLNLGGYGAPNADCGVFGGWTYLTVEFQYSHNEVTARLLAWSSFTNSMMVLGTIHTSNTLANGMAFVDIGSKPRDGYGVGYVTMRLGMADVYAMNGLDAVVLDPNVVAPPTTRQTYYVDQVTGSPNNTGLAGAPLDSVQSIDDRLRHLGIFPGVTGEADGDTILIHGTLTLNNDFFTASRKGLVVDATDAATGGRILFDALKTVTGFTHESGHIYSTTDAQAKSVLFENLKWPQPVTGSSYAAVSTLLEATPGGCYSDGTKLYFTTWDFSDPNTNGRTYQRTTYFPAQKLNNECAVELGSYVEIRNFTVRGTSTFDYTGKELMPGTYFGYGIGESANNNNQEGGHIKLVNPVVELGGVHLVGFTSSISNCLFEIVGGTLTQGSAYGTNALVFANGGGFNNRVSVTGLTIIDSEGLIGAAAGHTDQLRPSASFYAHGFDYSIIYTSISLTNCHFDTGLSGSATPLWIIDNSVIGAGLPFGAIGADWNAGILVYGSIHINNSEVHGRIIPNPGALVITNMQEVYNANNDLIGYVPTLPLEGDSAAGAASNVVAGAEFPSGTGLTGGTINLMPAALMQHLATTLAVSTPLASPVTAVVVAPSNPEQAQVRKGEPREHRRSTKLTTPSSVPAPAPRHLTAHLRTLSMGTPKMDSSAGFADGWNYFGWDVHRHGTKDAG